jgi:hypothetical protein
LLHLTKPTIHTLHLIKPTIHTLHLTKPTIHTLHLTKPTIHTLQLTKPTIHTLQLTKPTIHTLHLTKSTIHTLGRTPLGERPDCRGDLYMTTHNDTAGIRTGSSSKRAAVHSRLRPCSHRDQHGRSDGQNTVTYARTHAHTLYM